mmetsp:Transcript_23585/g.52247  ORF Transcript_23585/g.52247 Transcript_23585/m.52247 type:complete len:210 (+) Transcript_23585:194-823(+)
MHHGAVPVSLNVSLEALLRHTPAHQGSCLPELWPHGTVEALPQVLGVCRRGQVYECIPETQAGAEVHREVNKVEFAAETSLFQQVHEHVSRQRAGQVSKHQCSTCACPAVITRWAAGLARRCDAPNQLRLLLLLATRLRRISWATFITKVTVSETAISVTQGRSKQLSIRMCSGATSLVWASVNELEERVLHDQLHLRNDTHTDRSKGY